MSEQPFVGMQLLATVCQTWLNICLKMVVADVGSNNGTPKNGS